MPKKSVDEILGLVRMRAIEDIDMGPHPTGLSICQAKTELKELIESMKGYMESYPRTEWIKKSDVIALIDGR